MGSRFVLGSRVGRSRDGAAWRAMDLRRGLPVVLHVIPAESDAQGREIAGRLHHGRPMVRRLGRSRVAMIRSVVVGPRTVLVSIDRVLGPAFSELVRANEASLGEVCSYLADVCETLSLLHGAGVSHLALSLSSIMIDQAQSPPRAVIADPELSRLLMLAHTGDRRSNAGPCLSIEQQSEQPELQAWREDIWAVGAILVEVLERLFPGAWTDDRGSAIPDSVPIECLEILRRCQVPIRMRSITAAELGHRLRAIARLRILRSRRTESAINACLDTDEEPTRVDHLGNPSCLPQPAALVAPARAGALMGLTIGAAIACMVLLGDQILGLLP